MALFKTIEKLAEYVPVLESAHFGTILPALETAEDTFLRRHVMGPGLYDALHTAYQNQEENITDAALKALLPFARRVSAHMAMKRAIPLINAVVGSGGVMVGQTPNQAPASRWRVQDMIAGHMELGYAALDRLMEKLQEEYSLYPTYAGSSASVLASGIVRKLEQVQRVVNINHSGYLFLQMKPAMDELEATVVRQHFVVPAIYDLFVMIVNANTTLTPTDAEIERQAIRTIVHGAFARTAVDLSLAVNAQGITTFSATMNGDGSGGPTPAGDPRVAAFQQYHAARYEEARTKLTEAIRAAAESGDPNYAAYLATEAYKGGPVTGYRPDTDISTFFTGM